MGSDVGDGGEDDGSWSAVVRRGTVGRGNLPPELQRRLQVAAATLGTSKGNARGLGVADNGARRLKALYFTDFEKKPAREMREAAQMLLEPEDKGVVPFIDFIGSSVIEILVDARYERAAVTALKMLEWRFLRGCSPLVGFAAKYRSESRANRMLYNATRLRNRCENILGRPVPVSARRFYENLLSQAEATIAGALREGADVPEDVLYPPRRLANSGGNSSTAPRGRGTELRTTPGSAAAPTQMASAGTLGGNPTTPQPTYNSNSAHATPSARVPATTNVTTTEASANPPPDSARDDDTPMLPAEAVPPTVSSRPADTVQQQ